MKRHLTLLAALTLLAGFATSSQAAGAPAEQWAGNLELVSFTVNDAAKAELGQQVALYRSAQLAKARNKPFFILYNNLLDAAIEKTSPKAYAGVAGELVVVSAFVLPLDAAQSGAHNTDEILGQLKKTADKAAKDLKI